MKSLARFGSVILVLTVGSATVLLFQNCSSGSVPSEVSSATPTATAGAAAVTTPLLMYPASTSVAVGGTVLLTVSGGTAPYAFNAVGGGAVSTDPLAGYIFTAPGTVGTVVITVTDAANLTYSASLSVVAATSTTPVVTAASKPIYRFFNQTTAQHSFSDQAGFGGGVSEGQQYLLLTDATSGGVPFYRCQLDFLNQQYPTSFFFDTTSSTCENYNVTPTLLGYIYPSASTASNTQPLYRFRINFQSSYGNNGSAVDHIDSTNQNPPAAGWVLESVMGYVPIN